MTDGVTGVAHTTPEVVRVQARTVLLLALDRQERLLKDEANALTASELAQTVSALGRVALPASESASGPVTITVVRRSVTASAEVAEAEVLEPQALPLLPTPEETREETPEETE